jgi:hypothetical protein
MTKTSRLLKYGYSCIGTFHHNPHIYANKIRHRYFSGAGLKMLKWCHMPMLVINAKILEILQQGYLLRRCAK